MSYYVNFNVSVDDLAHHVACNLALYADVDRAIVYVPAVDTIYVIKEQLPKKGVHCAVYSGSFTDVETVTTFPHGEMEMWLLWWLLVHLELGLTIHLCALFFYMGCHTR